MLREIRAHDVLDVRVLHLHGHPRAVVQARAVHLGERGRGERRLLELGEDGVEGLAELALDRRADHLEGLRRHRVVALLQPLDEGGREHVGARRHRLAQS